MLPEQICLLLMVTQISVPLSVGADSPPKNFSSDEPIAFNPGMIKPHATLQNTLIGGRSLKNQRSLFTYNTKMIYRV